MKTGRRMVRMAWVAWCGIAAGQSITIDEVVRRAEEHAGRDHALKVAVAASQEQLVEAQSKFRLDLRPRLALFAFSNPALLATSLGTGLLLGRNTPPPWVRQHARLDRIAAEIAAQRALAVARREAQRAFFHCAVLQQSADSQAELLRERRMESALLVGKVQTGEMTNSAVIAAEDGMVSLELQWKQTEYERMQAAIRLAALMGRQETAGSLRTADLPLDQPSTAMPTSGALYRLAFRKSDTVSSLKARIGKERELLVRDRRLGGTALSLGYAHMNDGAGSTVGLGSGGFLLGGHTMTIDLGFRISLRKTGEAEAIATGIAARIAGLEQELVRWEMDARQEIEALRALAVFSREKAQLASRRLRLAEQTLLIATEREKAGLAPSETVSAARTALGNVRGEHRQAQSEERVRWGELLFAAGVDWKQVPSPEALLAAFRDEGPHE